MTMKYMSFAALHYKIIKESLISDLQQIPTRSHIHENIKDLWIFEKNNYIEISKNDFQYNNYKKIHMWFNKNIANSSSENIVNPSRNSFINFKKIKSFDVIKQYNMRNAIFIYELNRTININNDNRYIYIDKSLKIMLVIENVLRKCRIIYPEYFK